MPKKVIFSLKYLHVSKKNSTFARFLKKNIPVGVRFEIEN